MCNLENVLFTQRHRKDPHRQYTEMWLAGLTLSKSEYICVSETTTSLIFSLALDCVDRTASGCV